MPKEYIYPDTLATASIGGKDFVAKRIWDSISLSGSLPYGWDAVTHDEAWQQTVDCYGEWSNYLEDRQNLPGGLIERELILADGKLVAVAFIGLKNLDRPDGWKTGFLGSNNAVLTLGNFPNKIRL